MAYLPLTSHYRKRASFSLISHYLKLALLSLILQHLKLALPLKIRYTLTASGAMKLGPHAMEDTEPCQDGNIAALR